MVWGKVEAKKKIAIMVLCEKCKERIDEGELPLKPGGTSVELYVKPHICKKQAKKRTKKAKGAKKDGRSSRN